MLIVIIILLLVVWWFRVENTLENDDKIFEEIGGIFTSAADKVKNYAKENKSITSVLERLDYNIDEPEKVEVNVDIERIDKKIYSEGLAFNIPLIEMRLDRKTKVIVLTDELRESGLLGIEHLEIDIPWELDRRKNLSLRLKILFLEEKNDGSVTTREMYKVVEKTEGNHVSYFRKNFNQRIYYEKGETKKLTMSITITPTDGGYVTTNMNGFPKKIFVKNIMFTTFND